MASCPHCGLTLSEAATVSGGGGTCPNCGRRVDLPPPAWQRGLAPVFRYFEDLWTIISHPTRFFRRMPLEGGVAAPLAFALVTHWLGSAAEFLWRTLLGGAFAEYLASAFRMATDVAEVDHPGRSAALIEARDRLLHWFWGTGSVVADPFLTLVSILFTTAFVFAGARLLVTPGREGAPAKITFESALRIVCYGMSPAVLAAIPLAGGLLTSLAISLVTIVGAREVYRIGTGRAVVVALFPKVLFFGAVLLGLFFLAIAVMKFVATSF